MNRSRAWLAAAFLASALAGVTTVAIASQGGSSAPLPRILDTDAQAPSATAMLPRVLAQGGFDVAGSRVALTTADGLRVIATTRQASGLGAEGQLVCALTLPPGSDPSRPQAGSAGCGTREAFNQHGLLSSGTTKPGVYRVSGLVPDGVSAVTVRLADGSTRTLDVVANAVALVTSSVPVDATFDGPTGAVSVNLSLPDAVLE